MKKDLINLYTVNLKYNRDLHNADDNVMSISPQIGKDSRVFVGIIVLVNTKKYCIPLTSYKEKFNIKSKEDFIKIPHPNKKNDNGAFQSIAVLNLNNMIPVADYLVQKVDLSKEQPKQNLMINELKWCRENSQIIINRANRLYDKVTQTPEKDIRLTHRCCDFKKLEAVLEKWLEKEFEKCNAILAKNPTLKEKLDAATVEYNRKHNLTSFGKQLSLEERVDRRKKLLVEYPALKTEYEKAEMEFDNNLTHRQNQTSPKPKHRR